MGGAWNALLRLRLDYPPELGIGCRGERGGSGRWDGVFLRLLHFFRGGTFIGRDIEAIYEAGSLVVEGTVSLLTAGRLVLPVTRNLPAVFLDLHVAELADHTEAAPLLPEAAHRLAAHGRLTVSERTAVSLGAGGVVEEIAVVSMVCHDWVFR